jgi:hypothetical protein
VLQSDDLHGNRRRRRRRNCGVPRIAPRDQIAEETDKTIPRIAINWLLPGPPFFRGARAEARATTLRSQQRQTLVGWRGVEKSYSLTNEKESTSRGAALIRFRHELPTAVLRERSNNENTARGWKAVGATRPGAPTVR